MYNGDIYTDLRDDPGNSIIKLRKSETPDFKVEGRIFKAYADKRFAYNYFIFAEKEDGTVFMKVLRQNNFADLTGFKTFTKSSNLIYIVDETFDDPLFI